MKTRRGSKARFVALGAIIGVIALAVAAVVYFTGGFATLKTPGPMVRPVSASVFSPTGDADNPGQADLAIDGDPATGWPTVKYIDAVPFPNFRQGIGLLLRLPEPTALSVVTVDVPSTGTKVQIRASESAKPTTLADTMELTPPTELQPGHNRIPVTDGTKTSNVLVWITTLGRTDGESRTEISDITLQAAA